MGDDAGADAPRNRDASVAVPLEEIPLHSTNLLTVLDAAGIIRYESPSIERVYGFEPEALVGDPVAEYFHPDDRERVVAAFQTVVDSEAYTVEAVEYRHECADGSYRWVESVASADPTPEGYYVVNTRDIAARKAREAELERTNEQLERFARVVSHDLKNPLTVARGRLELARETGEDDHLDGAANAVDRALELVDDLLTLALDADGVGEAEPVDLDALAAACWDTVETDDATLRTETRQRFEADEARLKQLLENLIGNAVDHGGDAVTVTVGDLDDGFYLADDGPGIPPDERERVFDAGYSTAANGAGLGLSIVEAIADAHGWEIGVAESRDGGARFEFTGVTQA